MRRLELENIEKEKMRKQAEQVRIERLKWIGGSFLM